jgi:hypothetical protein
MELSNQMGRQIFLRKAGVAGTILFTALSVRNITIRISPNSMAPMEMAPDPIGPLAKSISQNARAG